MGLAPKFMPGSRVGRLTVIEVTPRQYSSNGKRMLKCRCDCGNVVERRSSYLADGRTKSCGCLAREVKSAVHKTHGLSGTRTYKTWVGMKKRCYNKRCKSYRYYGGRGITVCDAWQTFESFFADMGEAPAGASIDRIDVNGNYEPGNCRWATVTEQARNNRHNVIVEIDGEQACVAEWAERYGVPQTLVRERLRRGWSAKNAVSIASSARGPAPKIVEHKGVRLSVRHWADACAIDRSTIYRRLAKGANMAQILATS